jgi:putative lipoprotein
MKQITHMHTLKPILSAAAILLLTIISITPTFAGEADCFTTVSGSVAYRQRIAMPPEALLTVRVEEVSRADAPAVLLAETREPFGERQVPIPFSLQVFSASVDPGFSYVVRASITVNDELRFTTTRSYPVLTRGATNTVDLLLEAVQTTAPQTRTTAAGPVASAELKDTYWKLVELDGTPVTPSPQQRREARITLAGEASRLSAFGGCNQLGGGYVQDGNALRFTQMAGTMMACEQPLMGLEDRFLKVLGATTGYRIEGQQLILLGGDQPLARFEAVYSK